MKNDLSENRKAIGHIIRSINRNVTTDVLDTYSTDVSIFSHGESTPLRHAR